jgi:hypothetical protein
MWPLTGWWRVAAVAIAAAIVFGAGFTAASRRGAADLEQCRGDQARAALQATTTALATIGKQIQGITEANNARAKKLEDIAVVAAGRPATVIRLRGQCAAVPAAGGGAAAGDPAGAGAGVVGDAGAPLAGPDYDTSGFWSLIDRAKAVSVDLNTCMEAWPR